MKDELRYKLKVKRKYFSGVRREFANEVIAQTFLARFGGYNSYFIYNSFGSETDTSAIISALKLAGKEVYLPRTEGENIVPVAFGKTIKGAFGIEEPQGQAFFGDIDVTVIPLLAVNSLGYRTGYGKGYYDRYLKTARTYKVGLGYFFQKEEFTQDEWDEPLDAFVSERGIVYFENKTHRA